MVVSKRINSGNKVVVVKEMKQILMVFMLTVVFISLAFLNGLDPALRGTPKGQPNDRQKLRGMEITQNNQHESNEEQKEYDGTANDASEKTYQQPQEQRQEDYEHISSSMDELSNKEAEKTNGVSVEINHGIISSKEDINKNRKPNTYDKIHILPDDNAAITQNDEKNCTPKKNICFLKVHKCAGSTVTNILQRYGKDHKLRFVLPPRDVNLGYPQPFSFYKSPTETFNLLVNHAVFHEVNMKAILPNDTIFIGIWREPLNNLLSVYGWFNIEKKYGYPPVDEFLRAPGRYNITTGHGARLHSYTLNYMSFHYGFNPMLDYSKAELVAMTRYLDKTFSFFIIVEYMNESLLLLKKLLCWTYKDILYLSHKVNNETDNVTKSSKAFLEHSKMDAYFYNHYKQVLLKKIFLEGERLQKELTAYEDVLSQTINFCSDNAISNNTIVQSSPVIEPILLTKSDCHWMALKPKDFVPILRALQSQTELS